MKWEKQNRDKKWFYFTIILVHPEKNEKKTFHATNENNLKIHDISVESVHMHVMGMSKRFNKCAIPFYSIVSHFKMKIVKTIMEIQTRWWKSMKCVRFFAKFLEIKAFWHCVCVYERDSRHLLVIYNVIEKRWQIVTVCVYTPGWLCSNANKTKERNKNRCSVSGTCTLYTYLSIL